MKEPVQKRCLHTKAIYSGLCSHTTHKDDMAIHTELSPYVASRAGTPAIKSHPYLFWVIGPQHVHYALVRLLVGLKKRTVK